MPALGTRTVVRGTREVVDAVVSQSFAESAELVGSSGDMTCTRPDTTEDLTVRQPFGLDACFESSTGTGPESEEKWG